jgi:hypothetical protein
MPKFIIERNIPGAGKFTPEQLRAASQKSVEILCKLGTEIQWIHSYVAGDKIYCIYLAPSEELIREHAKQTGFPIDKVTRIDTIIEPATAD